MQLSLREYIGTITLDELLAKKEDVTPFIMKDVAEKANALGMEIITMVTQQNYYNQQLFLQQSHCCCHGNHQERQQLSKAIVSMETVLHTILVLHVRIRNILNNCWRSPMFHDPHHKNGFVELPRGGTCC